jgi:hypothetical protein
MQLKNAGAQGTRVRSQKAALVVRKPVGKKAPRVP